MPRHGRIDIAGQLCHVLACGNEGWKGTEAIMRSRKIVSQQVNNVPYAFIRIAFGFTMVFIVTLISVQFNFFMRPSHNIYETLFSSNHSGLLLPFLICYLIVLPMTLSGSVTARSILAKSFGFLFTYLIYFFWIYHILIGNPGVGAPIGAIYIPLSIPFLMPTAYMIGYGGGLVLYFLYEKWGN